MAIDQDLAPDITTVGNDKPTPRQKEGRYQTILENMAEAYYEVDLAGNHVFFTDALCEILRFDREELQGMNYRDYMKEEISFGVYKVFNEVFRTGKPRKNFAYEITRGDGEIAYVELSVDLLYDEDGEPSGFKGIIRDHTERHLAELQLQQSYDELEKRVAERTAELAAANDSLQKEIAERRQVEATLERRNRFLEVLTSLSREASFNTDFDNVLQTCINIAGEMLNASSAYISTWDHENGTTAVIAEYYGPRASKKEKVSDLGVVYSIEEEFGTQVHWIGELIEEPYVINVDDPDIDDNERDHFKRYGNKTELGVPLLTQGRAYGLLEIWESEHKRVFTREEMELAKQIAFQIATIVHNNLLFRQAQQEIEERRKAEEILTTLNEIAQETYSVLDLTSIFERIVNFTGRFMNATSAYISRINMDARTIEVAAEYFGPRATEDERISDLGETYRLDTDFSTSARLIDAGEEYYVIHHDDKDILKLEKEHMEQYDAKSIINFIMRAKDRPIAVLEFWDSQEKREFDEEEVALIRAITNQVSRAIENAELYEQVTLELQERSTAEKALRESQEVFRALTESAQSTIYLCYNEPGFPMIYLNDFVEKLTGYPKEDFLEKGLLFSDLFHPEDRVLPEDVNRLQEVGSFNEQYRIKHRDGTWHWVEDVGSGVVDQDGNFLYLAGIINDITNRKLLEEQVRHSLERRSREVELSTQVAREIAAAPDLNDLYRRVVTQVKEQFGFYHVQLLRYDPLLDAVALIAGYGKVGLQMLVDNHQMPMGVGLIGSAAATGESFLRPDVTQDPNWQPNPLLPETRGELAVPIKLGNEVLGILDVQSDVANALSEDDQLALEGLCGQIAVAIESTRLRQEMAERLEELNQLQRLMSREGWRSFKSRKTLDSRGYIFNQNSTEPLFSNKEQDNGRIEVPADAFKTGEFRQIITSPLTMRGEKIGTLAIQDEENQPLTAEDRDLLQSISDQVAQALESARLLEQTQKNAADMETVVQVGSAASTILEAQDLLQTVVSLTQERFDLYFVSIFAMDEQQGLLRWVSGTKLPVTPPQPVTAPEVPLDMEQSLIAAAGRTRKPVVVNDVKTDSRFLPVDVLPDTRSELVIPLIVGDELLGVMDLQSDVRNRFGEDDVRIHITLATQIAVAWKNANLYAEQLDTAERLRQVDRLKTEFMASMSHELRTPLNSIIGFSDVLLEGMDGPLTERMTEDVTLIRDSGRHLRELISEILDMSKIEAGMMDLRYAVVDLNQVAREIVANARSLIYNKDIDLHLEMDPSLSTIEADRTRLVQILFNLVSNAIKFTNKGTVSLVMKDAGDEIEVMVQDTGIGIKESDIPIIFEQFRQIDGSLTRKAGGTGLGMPISKSLVELHGGQMSVHSEPDVGSTFSFTIPKTRPAGSKPGTGPLQSVA